MPYCITVKRHVAESHHGCFNFLSPSGDLVCFSSSPTYADTLPDPLPDGWREQLAMVEIDDVPPGAEVINPTETQTSEADPSSAKTDPSKRKTRRKTK